MKFVKFRDKCSTGCREMWINTKYILYIRALSENPFTGEPAVEITLRSGEYPEVRMITCKTAGEAEQIASQLVEKILHSEDSVIDLDSIASQKRGRGDHN